MALRIVRALQRYASARGGLLAGGIAYTALFSIAAALTIGITLMVLFLGGNPQLREQVFASIAQSLPGVLDVNGSGGILKPDSLVMNTGFSITGIVAVAVLLFSAVRVMAALKTSIRSMFGIVIMPGNPVLDKLRDFLGFIVLMVAVLLTAVLSLAASTLGAEILDRLGVGGSARGAVLSSLAIFIGALVDAGMLYVLIRLVARVRPMRRDMIYGAIIFAVASAVLRRLGTQLVSAVNSPLLASFAAIITVMLWVNLLARVALITAAFIANPPAPEQVKTPEQLHAKETPNYITVSQARTLHWPRQGLSGQLDVENEEPEDAAQIEAKPYMGGAIGAWLRGRIRHHRRRIAVLQRALGK